MEIRDRPTAPCSPWQNGHVERLIGSIRRESLDHLVVFDEAQLRSVLKNYASYYNQVRTHLSLHKNAPDSRRPQKLGRIASIAILGGLRHQYVRGYVLTKARRIIEQTLFEPSPTLDEMSRIFHRPIKAICAFPSRLAAIARARNRYHGKDFMSQQDLEAGFKAWQDALNRGDMETFFAAMDDDIVIYDEDIPWRFSKADMIDHLSFHAKVWDAFQWVPRELRFQTRGDIGIVSGFATFRGKPKDAGFRQRFMGFTQTWMRKGAGWTMLSRHQGPLNGQLDGASPS